MKTGVIFSMQRAKVVVEKGNINYLRHYGAAFEHFLFLNLVGSGEDVHLGTNVKFKSIGLQSSLLSFLISPWRLSREVKNLHRRSGDRPVIMTADQWYSWWPGALLRMRGYRFAIVPVCIPEVVYEASSSTPTLLPKWVDRALRFMALRFASALVITSSQEAYVKWSAANKRRRKLTVLVDVVAESLPSPDFILGVEQSLLARELRLRKKEPICRLLYVGRLHQEKQVDHVLRAISMLHQDSISLDVIGDGPALDELRSLAVDLQIDHRICFLGSVDNSLLPPLFSEYDVFVAPLAGTSLREAAACGLAIVTYDADWTSSAFSHGVEALLAPNGSISALADALSLLANDRALIEALSERASAKAKRLWCRKLTPQDLAPISKALQCRPVC